MNEDLTQLWMVPYADLMSTMVLLFMSLFAYAYANKSPEYDRALARIEKDVAAQPQAVAAQGRLDDTELAVRIQKVLDGLSLNQFGVQVTSRYVRLTLPSPVLFDEASVRLSPQAGAVLTPLARLLAQTSHPVLVEGHTDDVPVAAGSIDRGRFRSNYELSAGRAFSVVEFFLAQGLSPDRFQVRGYGEYRPVASNSTPEGRARNRRIQISIVRGVQSP